RVFAQSDPQEAVFNDVAPLLTSLLDGYNVCIMAYGQTGSGKTHTMLGGHASFDNNDWIDIELPHAQEDNYKIVKCFQIDLGMSGVTGSALRETRHINRSLSALADVLGALAENRTHVPYRNSKLTQMLQDSIGGDAKLLVFLCVSPMKRHLTESMQCLGFGSRARQIQRGAVKQR
ncbi:uncharacterized protein TRIADDRAFT_17070, partial [Trichoplax adhaerens]